jgi:flagellin
MERLSTGVRINSAKDDAAGLAIAAKQTSQIRGLDQAVRNANDAVSLIQTAEGALIETTNMLQRMRELAVQSASDSNVSSDRTALNQEFGKLREEINRVGANTQWNGTNILNKSFASSTGTFKFQVGANAAQTIDISIGNYTSAETTQGTTAVATTTTANSGPGAAAAKQVSTVTIAGTPKLGDLISVTAGSRSFTHTVVAGAAATQTVTEIAKAIGIGLMGGDNTSGTGTTGGTVITLNAGVMTFTAETAGVGFDLSTGQAGLLGGVRETSITSQANSNSAIAALDVAIATVNTGRSEMGATMNRLQYAADNLANISSNATESRGRILDTDYATETTELARTQIIAQAGTAMLAQANQMKQTVLSLLK